MCRLIRFVCVTRSNRSAAERFNGTGRRLWRRRRWLCGGVACARRSFASACNCSGGGGGGGIRSLGNDDWSPEWWGWRGSGRRIDSRRRVFTWRAAAATAAAELSYLRPACSMWFTVSPAANPHPLLLSPSSARAREQVCVRVKSFDRNLQLSIIFLHDIYYLNIIIISTRVSYIHTYIYTYIFFFFATTSRLLLLSYWTCRRRTRFFLFSFSVWARVIYATTARRIPLPDSVLSNWITSAAAIGHIYMVRMHLIHTYIVVPGTPAFEYSARSENLNLFLQIGKTEISSNAEPNI